VDLLCNLLRFVCLRGSCWISLDEIYGDLNLNINIINYYIIPNTTDTRKAVLCCIGDYEYRFDIPHLFITNLFYKVIFHANLDEKTLPPFLIIFL